MEAFKEFAKIARLSRECVVTEKIDGTNAQVHIAPVGVPVDSGSVISEHADGSMMLAGSRNRYITPAADNFGFAAWVKKNADTLWALGPGRHFGEWWGSGVQRGYGLTNGEKRFSLFNVSRWEDDSSRPACCGVVPVLYRGVFDTVAIENRLSHLKVSGSLAAPGFMRPEGVVIWHEAARVLLKKTIEKDEAPKSALLGKP